MATLLKVTNGRYSNLSNDKNGWNRVHASIVKTKSPYSIQMVKTQCAIIKKNFQKFEKYANQSQIMMLVAYVTLCRKEL